MEFLKCTFLAMTVLSSFPMENGSVLKNEVTPAPTLDFAEFIEQKDSKDFKENVDESANDAEEGTVVVTGLEDSRNVKHQPDIQPPLPLSKNRPECAFSQPVCKYGMKEIFLYGVYKKMSSQEAHLERPTRFEESISDHDIHGFKNCYKGRLNTESKIIGAVAGKKSRGDDHVNLEVSDMQSFEEWKNLKLQEKESRLAGNEIIQSHMVRAKKTQVNYASQDCGAKVLSHNKEAKHVSAILDENKDMYMLNPCSTSIWFVIELCEPIQVQQFQVGNLELFSSAPKEFSVSVSERYPAREWHYIGTFEATNERNLQTFSPKAEGQMFAKYIKFDMLSHFSNEHFCPLTLVRVLGVSMVDEFDEPDQMPSEKREADTLESRLELNKVIEGDDRGSNGPINTMLNIVKTAMGLGNIDDKENENNLVLTGTNSSKGSFDSSDNEVIDPTAESEIVLVTNEYEVAVTTQNETQSFITLIETGNGEDLTEYLRNLSTYSSKQIPVTIPKFIHFLTPKLNVNVCWFLEFFCKVSIASCLVHYPYNYSAIGVFLPLANVASFVALKSVPFFKNNNGSTNNSEGIPNFLEEPLSMKKVSTESFVLTNGGDDPLLLQDAIEKYPVSISSELEDGAHKSSGNILGASETEPRTNDKLDQDQLRSHSKSGVGALEHAEVSDEKDISVLKNVTEQAREPSFHSSINNTGHSSNITVTPGGETVSPENITLNASDTFSKSVANYTLSETPSDLQPSVVINPGTNQKDSVFMRLSNRIRVLEQNMSLSSDYLENLSQRFKKQMDEMQRAFDQTTSKLLTTGKTANENDARQTELIQQAQAEIQLLKLQVQNLSSSNDRINMQLVERHVCFIILEIIVFTAVLVTCLGRRIAQVRSDLYESEAMTESLKRIIEDIKRDKHFRANGHCDTILCDFDDRIEPSAPTVITSRTIRQNKCSAQKKKKLKLQHQGIANSVSNVEDIGNKLNCCVPAKSRKKHPGWNGDALNPKITNDHVKGRK